MEGGLQRSVKRGNVEEVIKGAGEEVDWLVGEGLIWWIRIDWMPQKLEYLDHVQCVRKFPTLEKGQETLRKVSCSAFRETGRSKRSPGFAR